MENKNGHKYREIVERYCSVIDANAPIVRTDCDKNISYECLSRAMCEKRFGGCRKRGGGVIFAMHGAIKTIKTGVSIKVRPNFVFMLFSKF